MSDVYDRLISSHPELERKGVKTPYTSVNGNMFTFITDASTLALRLPKDVRARYLEAHEDALLLQHGVVMKEYIQVTLEDTPAVRELFDASCQYAGTLKPKATTRPKGRKA